MKSTKSKGDSGEVIAIKYLQSKSYKILDSNFKFGRFGEIDIISKIGNITVFIEVKYRNNTSYGIPEESIIKSKLRKCRKTVEYYCTIKSIDYASIRFDVITILKGDNGYKLKHYKNIEI